MKKFLLSLFASVAALTMSAQTNLLENAGFESWTDGVCTGWVATVTPTPTNAKVSQSTDAHGGSSALLANTDSSNKRFGTKEYRLKAGDYKFTIWMKSADASALSKTCLGYVPQKADGTLDAYQWQSTTGDDGKKSDVLNQLSTEWTQYTYEFTLASETAVNLVVRVNKNTGNVLADDASLTTTNGGIADGGDTPVVPAADMTIAEAQAAAAGTNVSIAGTVFAACKSGAVIGDATGYIYYYNTASDLAVGDIVKMEGEVSAYGGFNQLTATAEVEKVSTGNKVTYPAVVKLDGAGLDAWYAEPKIQYVQVTGELVISGNYYNLNVDGAETSMGSLLKPLDSVLGDVTNNSKVTITGFAMYTSGGKYVNIVVTELVIGEKAETFDITNTLETAYSVSKCIELIDAGKGLENKVYIKGIICAPYKDMFVDLSYGNASFFISEDGNAESQQFEIYRGYDFGGAKFTEEKFKLGDEVVFYGSLTKYKDTYETNQGAELILLNGKGAEGISNITADLKNAVIYDLSGRRVNRAENGVFIINGKKVIR